MPLEVPRPAADIKDPFAGASIVERLATSAALNTAQLKKKPITQYHTDMGNDQKSINTVCHVTARSQGSRDQTPKRLQNLQYSRQMAQQLT